MIRINLLNPAWCPRPGTPASNSLPAGTSPLSSHADFSRLKVEGACRPGLERFFEPRAPLPSRERLESIQGYLAERLTASARILIRLDPLKTWAATLPPQPGDQETLTGDIRDLLERIASLQTELHEIEKRRGDLSARNAESYLNWVVSFYLSAGRLEEEVWRHDVLGKVLESEIAGLGWALEPVVPEASRVAESFPELGEGVRRVLLGYEEFLVRKKGGRLNPPIREQPFDTEAFAAAVMEENDHSVISDALEFVRTVWGQKRPEIDEVLKVKQGLEAHLDKIRRERRPIFPASFTIAEALAGEDLQAYLQRLGLWEEADFDLRQVVGVGLGTISQWGKGGRRPREIGVIVALYRFLVEKAWSREILFGRQGEVTVPDPMEILRLAYGEWGEPFFGSLDPEEPWTIVVSVPKEAEELSYAELYYGRVIGEILAAHRVGASQAAAAIRGKFEEAFPEGIGRGIDRSTVGRHKRGQVMPHRRFRRTRKAMRLLMGEGGAVFDFFLEVRPVLDLYLQVTSPGRGRILPVEQRRSQWKVRLVPQTGSGVDLTNGRPDLDADRLPYKYLQGPQDDFTPLLQELRARIEFMRDVQGKGLHEPVDLGEGEEATLERLLKELEGYETRHRTLLARYELYRSRPEVTPLSAPGTFESFYRRLLLFARTVRKRVVIEEGFSFEDMTIDCKVCPASPSGVPAPSVTARPDPARPLRWGVTVVPEYFAQVVRDLGLNPEAHRDLVRLRAIEEVLREKGIEGRGRRKFLVPTLQALDRLEREGLQGSRLDADNPDLIALYERADRPVTRREAAPLEEWLEKRFDDFFQNRFGLPSERRGIYLSILRHYFEIHPAYRETFDRHLFDQAIMEVSGKLSEARRGRLLEFLHSIGLPAGETEAKLISVAGGEPVVPPAAFLPPVPTKGSILPTVLRDFLDRAGEIPLGREEIYEIFVGLAGGRSLQSLLDERRRYLRCEIDRETEAHLNGLAEAFLKELGAIVREIDRLVAPGTGDHFVDEVTREHLLQRATSLQVEDLGSLTFRVVERNVRDLRPTSNAFTRTLQAVQTRIGALEKRVRNDEENLLLLMDLVSQAEGRPSKKSDFLLFFMNEGIGSGIPYFQEGDWQERLTGHETRMDLFFPGEGSEVRQKWGTLTEGLEEDLPQEVAQQPASPPTPVRLPAPRWEPARYALLSLADHRDLWAQVSCLSASAETGTAYCVFYLEEGEIQVKGVNPEEYALAKKALAGGGPDDPALRLVLAVDSKAREVAQWLASLPEEDPSHADYRFLESLLLFLPTEAAFYEPMAEIVRTAFLEGVSGDRWRNTLRRSLNRFFERFEGRLEKYLRYYRNVGPWYFTVRMEETMMEMVRPQMGRFVMFEKVRDLLDEDEGLPLGYAATVREAIRGLTASPRTPEDYERAIAAVTSLWGEATHRDARLFALKFPAPLRSRVTEFPELLHVPHLLVRKLEKNIKEARAEGEKKAGSGDDEVKSAAQMENRFFENVLRIVQDPDLEVLHRIFALFLFPGLGPYSAMNRALLDRINRWAGHGGFGDRRQRESLIAGVLDFYSDHRTEFFWRVKEHPSPADASLLSTGLPEVLPPRHPLFARFPEVEAVSFMTIDQARLALDHSLSFFRRPGFAIDVVRGGFWERFVVGVEEGNRVREVRGKKEGVIRVTDEKREEEASFSPGEIYRIVNFTDQESMRDHIVLYDLELRILRRDEFREIHPLLVLLLHTVLSGLDIRETRTFGDLVTLARALGGKDERYEQERDSIQEEILQIYERARGFFREWGMDEKIVRQIDNP